MRKVCITENCLSFLVLSSHFITKKLQIIISQTFLKKTLKKKTIVTQHFQNKIVLKKSREVMITRNQKLVLRYYKPNRQLYPEKFAYHVLLLFYPFINESDLFSKDGTY